MWILELSQISGMTSWPNALQMNARARRSPLRHGFAEIEAGDGSSNEVSPRSTGAVLSTTFSSWRAHAPLVHDEACEGASQNRRARSSEVVVAAGPSHLP